MGSFPRVSANKSNFQCLICRGPGVLLGYCIYYATGDDESSLSSYKMARDHEDKGNLCEAVGLHSILEEDGVPRKD